MIFSVFFKTGFGVFLVHPPMASVLLIRIGGEMLCLRYAGFFTKMTDLRTDGLTNQPTTRLLELLWAAKNMSIYY